jgi:hypothetical protein
MNRSLIFKIILFLALLQGIFGLLRAYDWVQVGVDLFGQGVLLLPFVATVAVMRGLFISAVALLYVLSVIGALLGKSWAWWTCLVAVLINLLLVLAGLAHGAPLIQVFAWSVIPIILAIYLFSGLRTNVIRNVSLH